VQLALAARTGLVVDIDDNLDPWQMRRQRAAVGASLCSPCGSLGRSQLIRCRCIARRRLLDVFKAEQHLIFGKRLGPAAKTVALQFLDDLAAADNFITPFSIFGHRKMPSSSRLANRQRPVPSQNTSLIRSARFALNT
jgi:hypothetical protein